MKKSYIFMIVLALVVQILLVSCTNSKKEAENTCGGTSDYSTNPEKIVSTDIKSFFIEFTHDNIYEDEKKYTCPHGRYIFEMKKENGNAVCNLKYYDRVKVHDEVTNEVSFEADLSYFSKLQTLIEEEKLESINGYHKENSALGDYLDLIIEYESGEKLSAFAQGGGVMPHLNPDFFILFFSDMAKEHGFVLIEIPEFIE